MVSQVDPRARMEALHRVDVEQPAGRVRRPGLVVGLLEPEDARPRQQVAPHGDGRPVDLRREKAAWAGHEAIAVPPPPFHPAASMVPLLQAAPPSRELRAALGAHPVEVADGRPAAERRAAEAVGLDERAAHELARDGPGAVGVRRRHLQAAVRVRPGGEARDRQPASSAARDAPGRGRPSRRRSGRSRAAPGRARGGGPPAAGTPAPRCRARVGRAPPVTVRAATAAATPRSSSPEVE